MGIAQRASVAALKFGVVLQRPTFGQCFFLPAFVVKSFSTAQPTFDLNSFSEHNRIIVPVQLFATKFAAMRVNLCWLLHFGDSGVGNVIEAIEGGTRARARAVLPFPGFLILEGSRGVFLAKTQQNVKISFSVHL